jgi:hypothetical protein
MKMTVKAVVASLALVAAAPAIAQPLPPPPPPRPIGPPPAPSGWDIARRIDWLQDRIARGRADGSLDWREARRVQRELDHIRGEEARMRARHDGRLWDRDRLRLEARLDELSDHIRWLRHNDERRPW